MDNTVDLNNNGVPDWAEERQDDWENHSVEADSPFAFAYENEQQVADLVPDYKNYKWYKQPEENYYYSYGEKVENLVENNPEESKEMLEQIADTNSEISKEDVEPLINEAEQLTDNNPYNDEVNNEAVREVSQEVFDNMTLDDIEKADAAAMKGEGDYLTVAQDLGFDDEDEFLHYFEQEGYQPEEISDLTEEQKEEIRNTEDKEAKFAKLKSFLPFGVASTSDAPVEEAKIESKENTPIMSGVRPAGYSFLGNSGGSSVSMSGINTDGSIENNDNSHSTISGAKTDVKVAEMDGNTASFNGANSVDHIDDTIDDLGFKDTEHEENIKTDEQADLPDAEFHSEKKERFELPDIKKMMTEQGGGIHLPFKFTVEGGELYISQIGTGRKLPFDDFLKAEPKAAKQLIDVMNGEK